VVSVRGRNSASLKQLPRQNRTILGGAKTLGAKVLGMVYNADRVPWRSPPVATYLRKDGMPATLIAASEDLGNVGRRTDYPQCTTSPTPGENREHNWDSPETHDVEVHVGNPS
jgi:hypothetical protein